ncbi:MAG: GFA family protein [Woeseiaceae bacterium]
MRYEVRGPETFACFCHCESCQRAAGAPLVAWATYARDDFRITRGDMNWHRSSPSVTRGVCSNCGTSLSYENERRPGEIDLTVNSLDDPGVPTLLAHIWTEDAQPWLRIEDDLPVYKRNIG